MGGSRQAIAVLFASGALSWGCGKSGGSGAGPVDASVTEVGNTDVGNVSDAPAGSCVIPPPSPPDWRLTTNGQTLRDGLGRVVFLRGVAAGGRSKFAPYVPFDYASGQFAQALDQYMSHAASWGIDAMRVPFTWAALEPTQGQNDSAWLAQYKQILDAAWAHGIWTVIDFHQDVYCESFCGDGFPSWTVPDAGPSHHDCPTWGFEYLTDSDVRHAFDELWSDASTVMPLYLSAWDLMIGQFQAEPGVVGFEPINEPGPGTADPATFEAATLTAFFTQMVTRMRQAAPNALVFVGAPPLDGTELQTQLQRPAGDGIVFAPHFYPQTLSPGQVTTQMQPWATIGSSWNVPVFVGEFGEPYQTAGVLEYITACFGALDALGMSGTQWEYSVSADVWNAETYGMVAPDGGEYPVAQALIRPFARAVAGSSIAQAWDATSSTFTLSYAPTSGTTEVQLPPRAYPSGYRVDVAGGCFDTTSVPGRMLVQPGSGAAKVTVTIAPAQ
jgi:endoglycosylceramidase